MSDVYSHPYYYEIAFSFRDIGHEVDVVEECVRRYATIPVRRVLELGSGPSPHMEEFARRGYDYVGLDCNTVMLDYAQQKARSLGIPATFIQADMRHFALDIPVDFAYVLLGSLYAETTEDVLSHLTAVAHALQPGGLYLLDWCIRWQWEETLLGKQSWTMERNGVSVAVQYVVEDVVDRAAQVCRNRLLAEVNDHGTVAHLESVEVMRVIFPQEFLFLVEKSGAFECVGWWNNWDLNESIGKQGERINRPITLIRRV